MINIIYLFCWSSTVFVILWIILGVTTRPKCMFIGGPLNGQYMRMHVEESIYVYATPAHCYIYERTDNNTFTYKK